MATYSWNCRTVDVYPTYTDEVGNSETDVVYNVHWRATGTEGEHSATSIGTQTLEVSDLSGFVSFEEVTHDNMIAWTKAALGEERVAQIEASLDAQLAALVTPTSVTMTIEG